MKMRLLGLILLVLGGQMTFADEPTGADYEIVESPKQSDGNHSPMILEMKKAFERIKGIEVMIVKVTPEMEALIASKKTPDTAAKTAPPTIDCAALPQAEVK